MSQENVERTLAAIDAFNRRDREDFNKLLAEGAEIVPVRAALEGTVFRGRNAAAEYCAAVEETWENLVWELEDVREGDGWVLALGRIRGLGRGSGATIDARGAWLVHFRHGLIARFRTYADRAEAFAAVGLQP